MPLQPGYSRQSTVLTHKWWSSYLSLGQIMPQKSLIRWETPGKSFQISSSSAAFSCLICDVTARNVQLFGCLQSGRKLYRWDGSSLWLSSTLTGYSFVHGFQIVWYFCSLSLWRTVLLYRQLVRLKICRLFVFVLTAVKQYIVMLSSEISTNIVATNANSHTYFW